MCIWKYPSFNKKESMIHELNCQTSPNFRQSTTEQKIVPNFEFYSKLILTNSDLEMTKIPNTCSDKIFRNVCVRMCCSVRCRSTFQPMTWSEGELFNNAVVTFFLIYLSVYSGKVHHWSPEAIRVCYCILIGSVRRWWRSWVRNV